eukprot:10186578-Alexandrium_andersonii.AAC.1
MSASLVGSEMCIRDRAQWPSVVRIPCHSFAGFRWRRSRPRKACFLSEVRPSAASVQWSDGPQRS